MADFELDSRQSLVIQDQGQSGLDITGDLTMVGWARLGSLPMGAVLAGKYHWGQSAQPNAAYRMSVRPGRRLVVSACNVNSSDAVAQHLDGALDEWQIYAEPLSESQIEALMAQTR